MRKMNRQSKNIITAGILLLHSACTGGQKIASVPLPAQAGWLLGTWQVRSGDHLTFETWTQQSPGRFSGKSYVLKGADSMVLETISLEQRPGGLYYIPSVSNQNRGQPVLFKAILLTKDSMVFENPEHDFPQQISYRRAGADTAVAAISGKKNGRSRRVLFSMKKIK